MNFPGKVVRISDNILIGTGLPDCFIGEVLNINVEFGALNKGFVLNLEDQFIKIVLLQGHQNYIAEGDLLYRTKKHLRTRVGFDLLGLVVTPLGVIINDANFAISKSISKELTFNSFSNIMSKAPSIVERSPIIRPLLTGMTVVDCFIPIGCGQRELIVGDNNSGKTSFAITTILNQQRLVNGYYNVWRSFEFNLKKNSKSHITFIPCVFVSIGKKRSEAVRINKVLKSYGALNYTCIVFSSSDDLAAIQYIAPYSGCTIGEWFRDRAYNSIVVYDDLTSHSVAYRQISLLLRRPPGREAYPGDIFYVHSRLLERAAQLSKKLGGGSLTALPIIETKGGDISSYIPTNVISITDGQIFLSLTLINKGIQPAVDLNLSVSRVGSKAQYNSMKYVTKLTKRAYTLYKTYEGLSSVGFLDSSVQDYINIGRQLVSFFKQDLYVTIPFYEQVLSLFAICNGYLSFVNPSNLKLYFNIFFSEGYENEYLENGNLLSFFMNKNSLESFLIVNSFDEFLENDFHIIFGSYQTYFLSKIQSNF